MNETQAIHLCVRHRDPTGFEFLVRQYRREAYFHALSLLGNPEDAADACQESFQRAFAAIATLSGLDRFYPWLYRILRNCCLNMLSRRKTAMEYARNHSSEEANLNRFTDPAAILAEQEEQQAVWQTLNELEPDTREILCLKYIHGHRYEEIARLLQIPRGTVMSRLFQARKAFRKKYLKTARLNELSERERDE